MQNFKLNNLPLCKTEKIHRVFRLTLRDVSRNFRAAVDNVGIDCEKVEIELKPDNIVNLSVDGDDASNHDLDVILKARLAHLSVSFDPENGENRRIHSESLASTLKNLENCTTRSLLLKDLSCQEILLLLPFFNVLGEISIDGITCIDQLREVGLLSQWSKVTSLISRVWVKDMTILKHLFHLNRFYVKAKSIPVESAIEIRDVSLIFFSLTIRLVTRVEILYNFAIKIFFDSSVLCRDKYDYLQLVGNFYTLFA